MNGIANTTTIVLIITISAIIFTFVQYEIYKRRAEKYSKTINYITKINADFIFHDDIQKKYSFDKVCDSKKTFDRLNYSDYLNAIIDDQLNFFETIVSKIEFNQQNYVHYLKKYDAICIAPTREDANKIKAPRVIIKMVEKKFYRAMKKSSIRSTSIVLCVKYTSPKGKNSYSGSHVFDFNQLRSHVHDVKNILKRKQTIEYQRSLMKPSLRYDIMHRDFFTCQICGSDKKDGVKLHVDHIYPVSKGGKTTHENLRTLCERCNLGKGAKIEH